MPSPRSTPSVDPAAVPRPGLPGPENSPRRQKPPPPFAAPKGRKPLHVFRLLEQGMSLRQIVIQARVPPHRVRTLHREWSRSLEHGAPPDAYVLGDGPDLNALADAAAALRSRRLIASTVKALALRGHLSSETAGQNASDFTGHIPSEISGCLHQRPRATQRREPCGLRRCPVPRFFASLSLALAAAGQGVPPVAASLAVHRRWLRARALF